jgi:CopG family nickel-responsive transcriptional regulator
MNRALLLAVHGRSMLAEMIKSAAMKEDLIRFGVAMEANLVEELDKLAASRGSNRSELLRHLTRAELGRVKLGEKGDAFSAVTLVYNHHVRELSERLTSLQHELGDQVCASMHVHLNHDHCMEVVVMRGRSDQLRKTANRMIGTKGVVQGESEYVSVDTLGLSSTWRRTQLHEHEGRWHAHPHDSEHARPSKTKRASKRSAPAKNKAR